MGTGYVTTNGIRMFYVEEGRGPLVLLCHGFPELSYSWRHQIGPLAAAGFRAVAVDLPGFGRSDKPDVAYDVVWVDACLAGLIGALGHDRAVVVGHDWGGLLAWAFGRLYPDLAAGIVSLNTADLPRPPVAPIALLRRISPDQPPYLVQFQDRGAAEFFIEADVEAFVRLSFHGPMTTNREAFPDEVVAVYADALRPRGAITPPLEYYRNIDRSWELMSPLADVRVEAPALMICAANDPVLSPAQVQGMEDRVPDLETVVIPDCGHWTQQERPAETTEALLGFLRRLDPWT